jgi:hypothetical protein
LELQLMVAGPQLQQVVQQQLEDADVARLSSHWEASSRYSAAVEEARRAAPATLTIGTRCTHTYTHTDYMHARQLEYFLDEFSPL